MNELIINRIWQDADSVTGFDPDIWRKDFAGAWIRKDHYGLTTKYGWVIDHIQPKSKGGDDSLENLQPLHWRNNASKGDSYETIITCVSSEGNTNIRRIRIWHPEN